MVWNAAGQDMRITEIYACEVDEVDATSLIMIGSNTKIRLRGSNGLFTVFGGVHHPTTTTL
jgi:hypothetical protein